MKRIIRKIPIFSYFGNAIETATFRHSSITFIGTAITGALGAVFYIIVARYLGPSDFGLFNVAITVLTLTSGIGDLGTDTGLVNFIPRYIKDKPEKALRIMKLGLVVKLLVSAFVLIIGIIISPYLAKIILKKEELTIPLRISFIGVSTLLLFSFITNVLIGLQKFWAWSILQIASNTLRIILVFVFIFLGILSIENTTWAYILMPIIGFVAGLFIIKPNFLKVTGEWSVSREFFSYNKWVAAFVFIAAISSRLDTFISARLLSPFDLGNYSAAQQMVKIVPMIVTAMGTVIAPKMASMKSLDELKSYIKKTQVMVLLLSVLGILFIPIVIWLIPLIFGTEYVSSGPYFIILLIGSLFFLISVPVHMSAIYYFSYPKLFFWVSTGHLIIILFMGWYFISTLGAMGAALTVMTGQIFNFIIPFVWVLKKLKSKTTIGL